MATKIQPQDVDTTQTFILSASQFSDGSAASPALTFSSDTTTGLFKGGTTTLSFTTGGTEQWRIGGAGNLQSQGTGTLRTSNGSVSAPSLSFASETNTGIFRSGGSSLGITLSGTQIIEFDPGVITPGSDNTVALGSTALGWTRLFMKAGTAGAPPYTFRDFSTTGLYVPGSNALGVSVTGNNTATLYSSSLTSNKRGVLYLNDLANEDGTSLFIGFGERTVSYSGNESGWLDLSKGDAAGTYLGAHNQIRLVAGANVQASTSYTSKDNTGRYFVLSPNPFNDDSQPIPGRTFIIGANTYTVRQYRNANSRLFVYEDISVEAATGTLTNVTYATTSFMAAANQIRVQDGSAASPSLSFLNSTNTGISRIGGALYFSIAGSPICYIDSTSISTYSGSQTLGTAAQPWYTLYLRDGTAALPSLTFGANTNTGIYRAGTNELSWTCGGTQVFDTNTSGFYPKQPIKNIDGSSASPSYAFDLNTNTGFFRQASGRIGMASNGFEAVRMGGTSSTSDGVTQFPMELIYGGSLAGLNGQTTINVSTTPVAIAACNDSFCIVVGTDGTNLFRDIVVSTYNSDATVLSSKNTNNSPAARTYTNNGTLNLAMASGTYRINCFFIDVGRR